MAVAVARRPVEQFDTQVPVPDWQLTPEEEMYGDADLGNESMQQMVDENGMSRGGGGGGRSMSRPSRGGGGGRRR